MNANTTLEEGFKVKDGNKKSCLLAFLCTFSIYTF